MLLSIIIYIQGTLFAMCAQTSSQCTMKVLCRVSTLEKDKNKQDNKKYNTNINYTPFTRGVVVYTQESDYIADIAQLGYAYF